MGGEGVKIKRKTKVHKVITTYLTNCYVTYNLKRAILMDTWAVYARVSKIKTGSPGGGLAVAGTSRASG